MKKILFLVLTIICMPIICKAEESNHFYLDSSIDGIYTMMNTGYKLAANYVKPVRKVETGEYVYCVSPGVAINPDGNYIRVSDNQEIYLNISKEKYEKIQIISYYGYMYNNHTDIKWYAITQYLIWQEVLPANWSVYFTETLRGDETHKFDGMINELSSLVQSYYLNPSIDLNIKGDYKFETVLNDSNNVLKRFTSDNSNVTINGSNLHIAPSNNDYSFNLNYITDNKKSDLYMYNEAQWVVSRGSLPSKKITYNVKIPKGNLTLEKKISPNYISDISLDNLSLENAKYAIYNDDYYKEYITDINGLIKINGLNVGTYTVKEIDAPYNFIKDESSYLVKITENNDTNLVLYEEPIIAALNIKKEYLDKDSFQDINEEHACFAIYDDNNNQIISKYTDQNGLVSFYLPYGHYYLRQLSGIDNYSLINDEDINVTKNDSINKYYLNRPIYNPIKETEKPIYTSNEIIDNPITGDNIHNQLIICLSSIIMIIVYFLKNISKKKEI